MYNSINVYLIHWDLNFTILFYLYSFYQFMQRVRYLGETCKIKQGILLSKIKQNKIKQDVLLKLSKINQDQARSSKILSYEFILCGDHGE